jgi:hypothetical protein
MFWIGHNALDHFILSLGAGGSWFIGLRGLCLFSGAFKVLVPAARQSLSSVPQSMA